MKDGCLKPEEIALALAGGVGDLQHKHLQGCAWCQALAASLGLFEDGTGLPDGADVAGAETRLGDFLQREIVGKPGQAEVIAPGFGRSRNRRRLAPTVWAAAAVLVVAIGLPIVLERASIQDTEIILRGQEGNSQFALALEAPVIMPSGDIQVSWSALAAASEYEVHVLDGERSEIRVWTVGKGLSTILRSSEIAALRDGPGPWFVVVVAKIDEDEIGRSLPRILR